MMRYVDNEGVRVVSSRPMTHRMIGGIGHRHALSVLVSFSAMRGNVWAFGKIDLGRTLPRWAR